MNGHYAVGQRMHICIRCFSLVPIGFAMSSTSTWLFKAAAIAIAFAITATVTTASVSVSSNQVPLALHVVDPKNEVTLEWRPDLEKRTIRFTLTTKTLGYIGFGLQSHKGSGGMDGADIVIGRMSQDGKPVLEDFHGVGQNVPVLDKQQNYHLVAFKRNKTHSSMTFERELDTCDEVEDVALQEGTTFVLWAFGISDKLEYHKSKRGIVRINLTHIPKSRPDHCAVGSHSNGSAVKPKPKPPHPNILIDLMRRHPAITAAKKGLPTYTREQVASHRTTDKRIWATLGEAVFDITDFIPKHPGGVERISMAAGQGLEPFFELYPVHFREDNVEIISHFRIGNLDPKDKFDIDTLPSSWEHEPFRNHSLIVHSYQPFCAEPPTAMLTNWGFYTPKGTFFIRNHLPVPDIVDPVAYRLHVDGIGLNTTTFTLHQLKTRFPLSQVSAVIQCIGNRQVEMEHVRPVGGKDWIGAAIGNALWSGVHVMQVLETCGFHLGQYLHDLSRYHVEFEGLDTDPSGQGYACSIPLEYLVDPNYPALLAYGMNNDTLPGDHGYPLRAIFPGIVGARNVKWVTWIRILDHESDSPFQQRDNKIFREPVTWNTLNYSAVPATYEMPVTSYICKVQFNNSSRKVVVRGYAYSGGGHRIVRVDLSLNQGKSWWLADILEPKKTTSVLPVKSWTWVLWEYSFDAMTVSTVTATGKNDSVDVKEIWVRAADSAYNEQSEDLKSLWNYRGYLTNVIHKVRLK